MITVPVVHEANRIPRLPDQGPDETFVSVSNVVDDVEGLAAKKCCYGLDDGTGNNITLVTLDCHHSRDTNGPNNLDCLGHSGYLIRCVNKWSSVRIA